MQQIDCNLENKSKSMQKSKYQVTKRTQPNKYNTIPDGIFLLLSGIFNFKIIGMNLFMLVVYLVLIVLMVYKVVDVNMVWMVVDKVAFVDMTLL